MKRISVCFFAFLLATSMFSFLVKANVGEEHVYGIATCVDLAKPVSGAYEYNMSGRHVNMVRNPGFEDGLEGWNKRQSWRPDLDMWSNITVDSTVSHSGKNSVRIEQHNFGYGYVRQIFYVGNQTVKHFRASAWARSENATSKKQWFDLLVFVIYEDGEGDRFDEYFSHGTHEWEYKSLLVSADEMKRVDHVIFYVRFQEEGGVAWFDDVSFVWVDTYVHFRCVGSESGGLANASVKVYEGEVLFGEGYTDENGTADFVLAVDRTYTFTVHWMGIFAASQDFEISRDTEVLITHSLVFETKKVTLVLRDVFGQPLANSVVVVSFRPLVSEEDWLMEQFTTVSNGVVECSVLAVKGEITVSYVHNGDVYEAKRIIDVGSDMDVDLGFDFVKFGELILPTTRLVFYGIVTFFLVFGMFVISYDLYRWKKKPTRLEHVTKGGK